MSVRAKFKCNRKTEYEGQFEVGLVPVTEGSEENEQFFKWTPSGSITLGTVNPAAAAQLQVGKEYYIDFIPAG